jgi:ankyrin repeat protein
MYLTSLWNPRSLHPTHDIFEDIRDDVMLPPCHQFVIDGALEQLTLHLEQCPDSVAFRDHYGFTILHWAVLCSRPELISAIIDAGADVNARSKRSGTVLMWAVSSVESARVCQTLIQAGAELDLEDDTGSMALHHALYIRSPDTGTIEVLLRSGADVNHVDGDGLAIIHHATARSSGSDIELLLAYGADINAEDLGGSRAIDHAIMNNNRSILTVLLKHSASANHHWMGGYGEYSHTIESAALYGDVATMRLLIEAHLTDVVMDYQAQWNYWNWFDTRPPPVYGEGDPPEALRSTFAALLQSITPRRTGRILRSPRIRSNPVPGAFPVDDSEHSDDEDPEDGGDDSIHADTNAAGDSGSADHDFDAEDTRNTDDDRLHASSHWMQRPTGSRQGGNQNCTQGPRMRRSSI